MLLDLPSFSDSLWTEIAKNVRKGYGPSLYPVGSTKRGIINGEKCTFIVLDHNRDYPRNQKNVIFSMTLWIIFDNPIINQWNYTGSEENDYETKAYNSDNCLARETIEHLVEDYFPEEGMGDDFNIPEKNLLLTTIVSSYSITVTDNETISISSGSNSDIDTKIFIPSLPELGIKYGIQQNSTNSPYKTRLLYNDGVYSSAENFPFRGGQCYGCYRYFAEYPEKRHLGYTYWTRSPYFDNSDKMYTINPNIENGKTKFKPYSGKTNSFALCPCIIIG